MSLLRIAPFLHKTTARGNGHSMVSAVALSVDAIERSWLGLCMGVFSAPGSTAGDGQRERRERLFLGKRRRCCQLRFRPNVGKEGPV